jgi:hypothetical protein
VIEFAPLAPRKNPAAPEQPELREGVMIRKTNRRQFLAMKG